jgi:iron complex outermembrane receptor protein
LVDRSTNLPVLKGLDVQVAVRHDDQHDRFSAHFQQPDTLLNGHARFVSTTVTAGAKVFPFPRFMIRGSYSTGAQPPALVDLVATQEVEPRFAFIDPKRGYEFGPGSFTLNYGGNPDLRAIRARTLALGAVFNPEGDHGPRISIDYSHIRRTNDYYKVDLQTVLNHEDLFPGRVTRLPLTEVDRAMGYTGGLITTIDARGANGGRLDVNTIDGRFEWTLPFAPGTLHLSSDVTLQLRNTRKDLLGNVSKLVGYVSGPLRWRANSGTDWTIGRTTVGANLQYFGSYRIESFGSGVTASYPETQGSKSVHAQLYLDIFASHRFSTYWHNRIHEFSLDLGIVNLLDHAPPYQTTGELILLTGDDDGYYSHYGDPRRRRIELTLNASF